MNSETATMIVLETQEAGTGTWFAVLQYVPGTPSQREAAEETAAALHMIAGLNTRVSTLRPDDQLELSPARIAPVPASPEGHSDNWEVWCPACTTHEGLYDHDDPKLIEKRDTHNREHARRRTPGSLPGFAKTASPDGPSSDAERIQ